jgi:hypothetical protein
LNTITNPTSKSSNQDNTNSSEYTSITVTPVTSFPDVIVAQRLGRRLLCRQQAIATACVYISRFYSKSHFVTVDRLTPRAAIRETNPYLVVATCLYIACKMEECPSHIRTVVNEAKNEWAGISPLTRSVNHALCRPHLSRYNQARRVRILRY